MVVHVHFDLVFLAVTLLVIGICILCMIITSKDIGSIRIDRKILQIQIAMLKYSTSLEQQRFCLEAMEVIFREHHIFNRYHKDIKESLESSFESSREAFELLKSECADNLNDLESLKKEDIDSFIKMQNPILLKEDKS